MRKLISLCLLGAVLSSAPLCAQTAGSAAIRPRKPERTTVKLLERQPDVKGLLLGLTAESVTVLVNSQPIDIPLENVRRVDVGGDSILNGTVIGGLVAGVWCAFVCGQGLTREQSLAGTAFKAALSGAAFGALLDGIQTDRRTIYRASTRPAPHGPRAALTVSVRF